MPFHPPNILRDTFTHKKKQLWQNCLKSLYFVYKSFEKNFDGTYKIDENEEGNLEITIAFGEDAADGTDKYAGTFSFVEGKEGDVEYIKIGGIKYTKQK